MLPLLFALALSRAPQTRSSVGSRAAQRLTTTPSAFRALLPSFRNRRLHPRHLSVKCSSGDASGDLVKQLSQLKLLLDQGALTEEEFASAKKLLLAPQSVPKEREAVATTAATTEVKTPTVSESPVQISNTGQDAKSFGRLAGKIFKSRVKEWGEFAENASVIAPAALKAAQRVAAPRVSQVAENFVNSTERSLEDFERYSVAVGKVLGKKTENALSSADKLRDAAGMVMKNRANRAVLGALGVNSSDAALEWAEALEEKANQLENIATGKFLKNQEDAKSASKIASTSTVDGDVETAAATQKQGDFAQIPPDMWAPAIDPATGKIYYWNYKTRETTWDRPKGAIDWSQLPPDMQQEE